MLAPDNAAVLAYARVTSAGGAVVVALNMSAQPQTLALGLQQAGLAGKGLSTLLANPAPPAAPPRPRPRAASRWRPTRPGSRRCAEGDSPRGARRNCGR